MWEDHAACAQSPDPNIFYPDPPVSYAPKEVKAAYRHKVEAAKAICSGCPVRLECLAAGKLEQHGIWGGLLPEERGVARPRGRDRAKEDAYEERRKDRKAEYLRDYRERNRKAINAAKRRRYHELKLGARKLAVLRQKEAREAG